MREREYVCTPKLVYLLEVVVRSPKPERRKLTKRDLGAQHGKREWDGRGGGDGMK